LATEVDTVARNDIESKLLELKQFRHDGARVPHKPLLVLLALHQLADTGSSRLAWSDIADRLADLIAEFGPSTRTTRRQSAAYPFTHLRTDAVWELSSDVPMDRVTPLIENGVTGQFTSAIEETLARNPSRIPMLARQIVDAQFPSTVAPDVLLAVGFDPDLVDAASTGVVTGLRQRRRSAAWRAGILAGWDAACAFCGFDGSIGGAPVGIEAAHIRWFNFDGPDDLDNGLALCSLHHKLFDRGVLGLSDQLQVQVSSAFRAVGTGRDVYELHGHQLNPRPGTQVPAERHIAWHRSQVFRGASLAG
jgi:putative restriction endonuclease